MKCPCLSHCIAARDCLGKCEAQQPKGELTDEPLRLLDFGHELLEWNRAQEKPPIAIGREYHVANAIRNFGIRSAQPTAQDSAQGDSK